MRAVNRKNNASPQNILYELMLYTEWNQETDFMRSLYKSSEKNASTLNHLWRPWDYFKKCESLLDEVANLQNTLLGWHFAVGEVGTVLAVLQDTLLEIRTARDDFSSVIGKATVAKDNWSQWRRLCWSPDCSILALAASNGAIYFYDLLGSNLFNIPPVTSGKESQARAPEHSLAGMFFISARLKNPKWPYELILVDYSGQLRSYYVSHSDGYEEFHCFSLSKVGVASVCWDSAHNLLIAATPPEHNHLDLKREAVGWGVSVWRLLNDAPYYRLAVPSPEDLARVDACKGYLSWVKSFCASPVFSVIFKMVISPDAQHLACLSTCGTISVWLLPSMRLHGVWSLKEQPDFDIQLEKTKKKRSYQLEDFLPVDISWWSEQKVILGRRNGAVSVCELNELRNLLGETPEFVCGEPRLSPVSTHKGILVLECETIHNQEGEGSSDEEESLIQKSSALVQSTVYLLTDLERFQPKRRRAKTQSRTFRLLGIKSTTPEELFSRKIDAGEFEEALHLAQVYSLDCDRVYQSQWRNSPVSEDTISSFLSKISKKRWVFEECYERVPDTLAAAKKLIEFGLKITSLSALAELISEGDWELVEDESGDKLILNGRDILSIPLEELSEIQKCLILTRRILLRFSDKLFTYEQMIQSSEEVYDREIYDKFRRQPVVVSGVDLARQSDHRSVDLLLTYQGSGALPYWLSILSNFPETVSPAAYKHLLPECSCDGDVFPWEQSPIRSKDWCENKHFDVLDPFEDFSEYNLPPKDEPLTAELVGEWYRNRIYQLELSSNMVDQPLELTRLARERNIKGLDSLYHELVTLDVLVYDVGLEDTSLRDLEVMTPLQKAKALMNQSDENNFVANLRHRLVPYLLRCESLQSSSRRNILSQFLRDVSSQDLCRPLKMFEYCAAEPSNSIVQNTEELMTLALEAIYAYNGTDQLATADAILQTLPASQLGPTYVTLFEEVKTAKNELRVAIILKERGHSVSLSYIHSHREDLDTAKALFLDLSSAVSNRVPAATEVDWTQLLKDLLQMQSLVFTCVPVQLCYEVQAAGVLSSGSTAVIRTAARSLCCHSEERDRKPLSLQQSVSLVLTASTQYFDSAASLTDSNIGLAKACLNLITEDSADVQEEKDLIAALQLLHEFKISLLPMQVRLCTERMILVESCLASRPTAYKDYHKLLSLAHKLRICGNNSRQREAVILLRVANIAFEAGDYRHSAEICEQLIDRRHTVGWEVCQRLGQCGEYHDFTSRQRLIAFALVYCPDDKVQELLETRCELEHMRLQMFIHQQTIPAETPSEDEEYLDAITSPQSPSKEFLPKLSSTLQNTSKLITQLTNSGFWKEKLLSREAEQERKRKGENVMEVQGFPEFYRSLHHNCHQSVLSADWSGQPVEWPQYRLIQAMLQASLLEQEKLPQQLIRDMDRVLVQYARLLLPEDSCVGLSALLSLSKPQVSEQCFSSLPLTLVTLQLAAYFLALLQALHLQPQAFFWTPDQVLSWAMSHAASTPDSASTQLLAKAMAQLSQFEHSKQVEKLNCGVNVRRFAWDHQYKIDSILGLAMCEEVEKLESALELGAAHGVESWQILLSHLHCLLLANSSQLPQRLSDAKLLQVLREQPETVVERLQENVLGMLSGVNHNQLISYYTVLQATAPDIVVNGLHPRDHIKLIKKVKATSPDIDYVRLVCHSEEVLSVLRPAVRKETVASVAKLLRELLKVFPSLPPSVTVSALYLEWAITQFKSEIVNRAGRDPLDQFATLQTYLQKMTGGDLYNFVRRAIFCHQSVLKLDVATRLDMIDSVLRVTLQLHMNDDPEVMKIQSLRDYLHQVWQMENSSYKTLRNYLVRLDEACGDSDAISTIIQTALVDASVPTHVLQKMAEVTNRRTLSSYLTDLLHSLPSHPALVTTILQRVEDCLARGEKGDSWSILIGPLTEKSDLPLSVRKLAGQISQRLGDNYSEELEALRLRTEAVLRSPISLSQVCDLNSRYLLFKEQLSQADSWDKLHILSVLLSAWPHVDTSWYLELIEAMAEVPISETFPTLQKVFKKNVFEEQEVAHLISRLENYDNVFTISICLITDFKSLHLQAIELLKRLSIEAVLPKELVRRIVETEILSQLISSPIFPQLRETIVSDSELRDKAATQWTDTNLQLETNAFSQTPNIIL